MELVVINLATETSRWAAVRSQFRAVALEPTRFEAICGADLSEEERQRLYSPSLNARQYHKPMQLGEIGCYASHLAVWQRLLGSEASHVAVFEDDIDLDPDLGATLAALDQCGAAEWDMVKLIGRSCEHPRRRSALTASRSLITYRRVPGLTSAYVISRSGAEKLLARRLPFGRPIDVDLRHWWECDLRIAGVYPYPTQAAPSSLLSTIEGRRAPPDRASRWRKFVLQARYTCCNWQAALGATVPLPARDTARRAAKVHHAPG